MVLRSFCRNPSEFAVIDVKDDRHFLFFPLFAG